VNGSRLIRRCGAGAAFVVASLFGGLARGESPCLDGAAAARAAQVVDARSLKLDDGRTLRLAGIEPFDLLRPDADEAEDMLRRRLAELAGGAPLLVQLAADETDRYGRYPALIAAGGALLQESLAGEGLAVAFAGGDALPCFQRILAAEENARRAGRGLWARATVPQAWPDSLNRRIGHFVIFEGRIVSVGNRSARTYLNFGTWWTEDVTAEIEARDREGFGGEAGLAALTGRKVRIRGFLQEKAGPMVALRSSMQLEVLDDDAGE
jgi:endonuclease YncB( thermonuclease family)